MDLLRTEKYRIGSNLFVKEYLTDGGVLFKKNNLILTLEEWNREINLFQSMKHKELNANVIIRYLEQYRRLGFINFVGTKPGDIVADIGCENGYMSEIFVSRGCRVICIDIDPKMVNLARERIGFGIASYLVSNINNIQLPDNITDITVASQILEHSPNPIKSLHELIRITKPKGHIFLSVPNEPLILLLKKILLSTQMKFLLGSLSTNIAIGHLGIFDKKKMISLCQTDDITIRYINYHKPFYFNIFAHLEKRV